MGVGQWNGIIVAITVWAPGITTYKFNHQFRLSERSFPFQVGDTSTDAQFVVELGNAYVCARVWIDEQTLTGT